jgi:hypothetical protein
MVVNLKPFRIWSLKELIRVLKTYKQRRIWWFRFNMILIRIKKQIYPPKLGLDSEAAQFVHKDTDNFLSQYYC